MRTNVKRISRDQGRFHDIIRGKIRKNLRKYISSGSIISQRGKDKISIPVPQIELPRFTFGSNQGDGIGQGEGEPGDPLGGDEESPGPGAGNQEGDHSLEVDVTLEELAEMLGEELELPNIYPKGKEELETLAHRYRSIRRVGPESLRHFRRTFKETLKRSLAEGDYDPLDPKLIFRREDRRYRSWDPVPIPHSNAVIIYMMDVSGSMGEEQKGIVRTEAFWIETWLKSQYENLHVVYITHDSSARVVDEHAFYHTTESGGTIISSAYNLCMSVILKDFIPVDWNIYPFHFSDGDNWAGGDDEKSIKILRDDIIPSCNMFCYGQVVSNYGSGNFIKELEKAFGDNEKVITSEIQDRDGILDSIQTFLGKGK